MKSFRYCLSVISVSALPVMVLPVMVLFGGATEALESDEAIHALIPRLASEDVSEAARADDDLHRIVFAAGRPGNSGGERVIVKSILVALKSDETPVAAQLLLMRQLRFIGKWTVPATLRAILLDTKKDASLREAARQALEVSDTTTAKAALRDALGKTEGKLKIGVCRSLGIRKDPLAVSGLMTACQSQDRNLRLAAIESLALIGEVSCLSVLEEAVDRAEGSEVTIIRRAYLRLADSLVDNQERGTARRIYIRAMGMGTTMRAAALIGVARAKLQSEIPKIMASLGDDDPVIRRAGFDAAELMKVPTMTKALNEKLKSAKGEFRRDLARVLASHGDAAAAEILMGDRKSEGGK